MPNDGLQLQATAQVIYMNHLLKLAKEKVMAETKLAFDPQGRVLTEITLDDRRYETIVADINRLIPSGKFELNKAGLDKALSMPTQQSITVSLDFNKDSDLAHLLVSFKDSLNKALENKAKIKNPAKRDAIIKQLPLGGSVIALQQEFYFHLALTKRIYQKLILDEGPTPEPFKGKEAGLTKAHQAAMLKINQLVINAYAKALKRSRRLDGRINIARLNKFLDTARQTIATKAHSIFMKEIIINTSVVLKKAQLEPIKQSLKDLAIETTATPNDILHTDSYQGLITLIQGSDSTSHHREKGEQFAFRQIITHNYNNSDVRANNNPRIQINTPSIALKEGLPFEQEYVDDVTVKLNRVNKEYQLQERLTEPHYPTNKPQAFIYNLYTALNDYLAEFTDYLEITRNLQTQSAEHIMQGVHEYNAQQLNNKKPVFCFVQNISVNGFGSRLYYSGRDALLREATVMTEIALLHTIYDITESQVRIAIDKIIDLYKTYLSSTKETRETYFSESQQGHRAIKILQDLKDSSRSKSFTIVSTPDDAIGNVKKCLKYMLAHELHMTHRYAKLLQTLSVYAEKASISGCKSGNERAQSINGRVAILDTVFNPKSLMNQDLRNSIKYAIQDLAAGNNVIGDANKLIFFLDTAYDNTGLQAAASIKSLADQGASSKVNSRPKRSFYISRNNAEEPLNNLSQNNVSNLQAHKGLVDLMLNAWEGHPTSFWKRMFPNRMAVVVGILFFPITIFVAIAVNLYNKKYNRLKRIETERMNDVLLLHHAPNIEMPKGLKAHKQTGENQQANASSGPLFKADPRNVTKLSEKQPQQPSSNPPKVK